MKLETHRCDLCEDLLYIPERSIHKLEIDGQNMDWKETFEICSICYDELMSWIKKKLQEEREEK